MVARRPAKRATPARKAGRQAASNVLEVINADGPCEEAPGDCPIMWEVVCRHCGHRLCLQHVVTHDCIDRWLERRLRVPIGSPLEDDADDTDEA